MGKMGKKRKENQATKVTKILKPERQKYGTNKTFVSLGSALSWLNWQRSFNHFCEMTFHIIPRSNYPWNWKEKDYTITYLTLTNLTINSTRDCAWPTRIWWNDLETTSAEMSGSCQSLEKLLYYVFLLSRISSIWVQGVRWRRLIYECWMVYCLNRIDFAELHIFVYKPV